jgi:outer membrane protein OmpA-like peptidoglycan-associated protein
VALPCVASAESRNVVIFFTKWSARIDKPAADAVRDAAAMARERGAGTLLVTGFADTAGSPRAGALLSATRAQVVVDQLTADGVPAARIHQTSKGSTAFVGTSLESRRVTITIPSQ